MTTANQEDTDLSALDEMFGASRLDPLLEIPLLHCDRHE
jgi:hypothetical protein